MQALISKIRKHTHLAYHMSRMSMKKENMGSIGGLAWWLIDPLFYAGLYFFVFKIVLKVETEDYVAFLLIGLVIYRWITLSVVQASNALKRRKRLIKQVDLPKIIFPIEQTILHFIQFLFAFVAITALLFFNGSLDFTTFYFLPLLICLGFAMTLATGILLSALVPLFPDTVNIIQLFMRALRYVSLIFFDLSQVPERYHIFIEINPIALLITSVRDVMMYGLVPNILYMLYIVFCTIVIGTAGIYMHYKFNRLYPRYML